MGIHNALRKEEMEFIDEHFKEMTIGEIALSLGRSYFTVQNYTSTRKMRRFHIWTEEETELLLKLTQEGYVAEYIARRLKVNVDCVHNRIRRLRKKGMIK